MIISTSPGKTSSWFHIQKGEPLIRKVIFFLTTFWLVIYSNARMPESVPSYNVVHWFPIPAVARLFELLLLVFLFVMVLAQKMLKNIFVTSICTASFIILAIFNLILIGGLTLTAIQEIYIRVVPYLFFVVVAQGKKASAPEVIKFVKFFTIILILNIIVAIFYQIPLYGYFEDNIHGFLEDAHLFCDYLLVYSVVLFYDFLNNKKIKFLLISLFLIGFSVYPRNEKAIAFCGAMIIIMFIAHHIKNARGLFRKLGVIAILLFVCLTGVFYLQKKGGVELWHRVDILVNTFGIENIGPVNAWPIAINEIKGDASSLLLGVGAGEYGWIAAGNSINEGKSSVHSKQFEAEFEVSGVNNSGFLFRTNTWSSLLAEFGLTGFILFCVPLFMIVRRVKRYRCSTRVERNLRMAFYVILLIVLFQGFFTPYSNWNSAMLVFPMMYLAAYFQKQHTNMTTDEINGKEVG